MAGEILSEMRGGAFILTFNRPDRGNSLTFDMANQLFQILKPVATDRTIRAVMLRGVGGYFMAGLDLTIYARDFAAGIERNNEILLPFNFAIRELHAMEKPVLTIVEGHVSGPGFGLMLAGDLTLAAKSATFSSGFAANAMPPDGAASFFLPRKAGAAKACEILMLDEAFDAVEAERLGLVNRVAEDSDLNDMAFEWIDRLASGPTRAYGAVKRLVGKAFEQDINTHISLEHAYWGAGSRSFDFRSAVKARLAKQPVKYTGA